MVGAGGGMTPCCRSAAAPAVQHALPHPTQALAGWMAGGRAHPAVLAAHALQLAGHLVRHRLPHGHDAVAHVPAPHGQGRLQHGPHAGDGRPGQLPPRVTTARIACAAAGRPPAPREGGAGGSRSQAHDPGWVWGTYLGLTSYSPYMAAASVGPQASDSRMGLLDVSSGVAASSTSQASASASSGPGGGGGPSGGRAGRTLALARRTLAAAASGRGPGQQEGCATCRWSG